MQTGRIQPWRSPANGQTRKRPATGRNSPGAAGVMAARKAAVSTVGEAASPSPPSTPSRRLEPAGRSRKVGLPLATKSSPLKLKHGAWA
jgi:hypothetical protein